MRGDIQIRVGIEWTHIQGDWVWEDRGNWMFSSKTYSGWSISGCWCCVKWDV